jgi:hypothetical protein
VRFRLFDRVRRSREPEPGHGAVVDRARGSGRHRLGAAGDRPPHQADPRERHQADPRETPDGQAARDARPAWADRGPRLGPPGGGRRARPPADTAIPPWAPREIPRSPTPPGDVVYRWQPAETPGITGEQTQPVGPEPMRPAAAGEAAIGGARARMRDEARPDAEPFTSPVRDRTVGPAKAEPRRAPARRVGRDAAARRPWYEAGNPGAANSVARTGPDWVRPTHLIRPDSRRRAGLPYAAPRRSDEPSHADGRRHCGSLERVLHRQWDAATAPPPEIVRAIDRLADLPTALKDKLAAGLDGIFIGPGGVPDLDDMQHLRGVPLPAGRATWDVCAGAYGGRKIVVGAQPSPTPDVMCHEIGHALDDIDTPGKWLSDQPEFRALYDQCHPRLVSDFHRQPGGLGRREFFADAFAAIASRQRPALVDMLGGDTRTALNVMLFFNRRYGI